VSGKYTLLNDNSRITVHGFPLFGFYAVCNTEALKMISEISEFNISLHLC
jgi:hypothetical protein